jgi:hypothetical protein
MQEATRIPLASMAANELYSRLPFSVFFVLKLRFYPPKKE